MPKSKTRKKWTPEQKKRASDAAKARMATNAVHIPVLTSPEPLDVDMWPDVAYLLLWNLYARLVGQNAFAHQAISGRKDKLGRNWKVFHARKIDGVTVPLPDSYIVLVCEADRALVDKALGDASRIRSVYSEKLRHYHALGREIDRLESLIAEQKQRSVDHSGTSMHRAKALNDYAEAETEVTTMRERYEACREIVATAQAYEFHIPFSSLEKFALYNVPFKTVQAKIPAPKLQPLVGMTERERETGRIDA